MLWLPVGLLIVAIISGAITWQLKRRVMRRLKAEELLDALARYSEWLVAQRAMSFFAGEPHDGSPVNEIVALRQQWFPELSAETRAFLAVHQRVLAFVSAQQRMRLQDPETWLELDHEARFMELWRAHLAAVNTLAAKLEQAAASAGETPARRTASPA
jgi:hypothetical protein